MTILPLNFDLPLASFASPRPIRVVDVEGRRENGRWMRAELPERFIRGVVLTPDVETLKFLSAGDASAGAVNIMTKAELHFTVAGNDGAGECVEGRQSYVFHQGLKFRVVGSGLTAANAGYNSYTCLRYFE